MLRTIYLLLLLCLFFLIPVTYSNTESEIILKRLEAKVSGLVTLETDFIQTKKMALFSKEIILKGKIFIQQPNLFSWHTLEPVDYIMVIKGDTIKQWDEETNRVQTISLAGNPTFLVAVNQMKVWFSGRYHELLKDYETKILSTKPVILEFFPKESIPSFSIIEKVKITFRDDERYIQRLDIEEKNHDSASIIFTNTKLNSPINPANWELK